MRRTMLYTTLGCFSFCTSGAGRRADPPGGANDHLRRKRIVMPVLKSGAASIQFIDEHGKIVKQLTPGPQRSSRQRRRTIPTIRLHAVLGYAVAVLRCEAHTMRATYCCSSLISSALTDRSVAPRSICGMYSAKGLKVCKFDAQQANEYLGARLVSLAETLPKFCPRPASKSSKQKCESDCVCDGRFGT